MRPIDIGILIVVAIFAFAGITFGDPSLHGKGRRMLRMLRWKLRFLRQRWECWCARRRSFQESGYSGYPVQDHAIEGMHCANCKKSVEKALTAQNGVIRADADVDRGIARVFYENGVDRCEAAGKRLKKRDLWLRILRRLSKRKVRSCSGVTVHANVPSNGICRGFAF